MINNIRTSVKINESLPIGTVISYNQSTNMWGRAQDNSGLLAILASDTSTLNQEDDGSYYVTAVFKGAFSAIASRNIPVSGGKVSIEQGKVFVDNTSSLNMFILPYSGQEILAEQQIVVIS